MATKVLTAELRADISKFETSVGQAVTIVKGLDRTVSQVNNELKKFGNEFGGTTLIRQANLAAKAVEDLGGATRLTAAEQKKLGTTVDQAIEKYRALGQEVPPRLVAVSAELTKIRTANEAAEKSAKEFADAQKRAAGESAFAFEKSAGGVGLVGNALKSIGPSIAATFSVGAVVSFGKGIVDLAGEISDLAARTGLGIEEVQEFQFAAEQTGATLEDIAGATEKLSDKLVSGDKSALKAFERLGLSFDELRNQSPGEAFTSVADAIGRVADPMERTNIALDVFGKSGTKVLPAISQGFSQLRQDARDFGQVMREDSVKALDEFGDRFGQVTRRTQVLGAEAGLAFVDAFKDKLLLLDNTLKNLGSGGVGAAFGIALAQTGQTVRNRPEAGAGSTPRSASDALLDGATNGPSGSFGRSSKAASDYTDRLKALRIEVANLTAAQKANIVAGDKVDDSNKEIAESLRISEGAVNLYLDSLKEASSASKTGFIASLERQGEAAVSLAKDIKELGGVTKLDAKQREDANKTLYEGVKAFQLLGQAASPAARQVHELARATTDVKEPLRNNTNEIERLVGGIKKLTTPILEPWFRLTTTLAGGPGGISHGLAEGVERIVREIPKLTDPAKKFEQSIKAAKDEVKDSADVTQAWVGSIGNVANAFATLAQVSGGSLDGIIGQVAQLVGLMNTGAQAGAGLKGVFGSGAFGGQTKNFAGFRNEAGAFTTGSVAAGAGQAFAQGAAAFSSLEQATNVKGRGNRAARGALTGAAIGNSIVPGYGALVGAAVGALVGALRNPAFEKVYKGVAKNFGVELSDETAKAIAKVSKDQFKGSLEAGQIFSLDSIIAEGGGLKDSNIKKLQARLRDAFVLKEDGRFSADQLTEVLEKNFGTFADFVGRSTQIAGKGFAEIAQLAKTAGVEVDSINEFVRGQTARVGGGLAALSQPLVDDVAAFKGVEGSQADLIRQRDAVAAKRLAGLESGELDDTANLGTEGGREFKAIDDELVALNKTIAENQAILDRTSGSIAGAQAEFDRLGIIAVGAFNAARASGLGFLDSVDQLSPGLDRLTAIQNDLGLAGNAAFGELLKFRDLVATNETVVASAEALNETILGLSNIGGLTVDTLAALEGQGLATFDKLTAAGFSTNQAIEIQRGFLENLQLAHTQLGVPIDENTQKLIDQANALAGLKPKDTLTVMEDGFKNVVTAVDRLTVALGGEVPAAAAAASAAITGVADTAEADLSGRAAPAITGCFSPLGTDVPKWTELAEHAVTDLADLTDREITRGCFTPTQAWLKQISEGLPDATSDAKIGITDLGDATAGWLEGSSKELQELAKKFRTTLPEAAAEAGRVIRDKIPRRIPVDVDISYNETGTPTPPGNPNTPADPTPNAATGAVVFPRPGGTRVNVAEAGQAEIIAPLNRLAQILPGSAQGGAPIILHVTGTFEGQPILRFVARGLPGYARTYAGLQ